MRTWTFPATGGTPWDDLWEDEPWRDYAIEADRAQDEAEEERRLAEQARLQAEAERARMLAAEERRQARLARRRAAAAARRREAKRRRLLAELAAQLAGLAARRLAEEERRRAEQARRLAELAGKLAAELGTSTEYAAAYLERFGDLPTPGAEQDAEPVEPIPVPPRRPVVADPASLIDNQFVCAERRRQLNKTMRDRRLVRPQEGAA